jgi:hypothetical protein
VKFVGNKTHGTLDSGRIGEFLHETTSTSTDRRFVLKETFASDLSAFPRLAAGTPGDWKWWASNIGSIWAKNPRSLLLLGKFQAAMSNILIRNIYAEVFHQLWISFLRRTRKQ